MRALTLLVFGVYSLNQSTAFLTSSKRDNSLQTCDTRSGSSPTRFTRRLGTQVSSSEAAASLPFDDKSDSIKEMDESSSLSPVFGVTFSLMKTLTGTGMLALPSGLAIITDYPSMLWGANVFLLFLGALSAYTFWLVGRLAHDTGGTTMSDLWCKVYPGSSARIVSLANLIYCGGLSLAYSLVLGDSLSSLLQSVLPSRMTSSVLFSREAVILGTTGTLLWPLCSLKSLAALAPFSIAGVLASVFATCFVTARCPALGISSLYASSGTFNSYKRLASPAPVVMIALGCVTWMGHFSAPEFYHALTGNRKAVSKRLPYAALVSEAAISEQQMKDYSVVALTGYSIVAILNVLLLAAGFLTFGGQSKGNILNNYATSDVGATVSRLLIAVSVASGYPFLISAGRSAAFSLASQDPYLPSSSSSSFRSMTLILLGLITGTAMVVKDAGFVVSMIGAIAGTSIIYIFPPLLFLKQFSSKTGRKWRLERGFCRFLIGFGAVSAVLGSAAAVLNTYFPAMLR